MNAESILLLQLKFSKDCQEETALIPESENSPFLGVWVSVLRSAGSGVTRTLEHGTLAILFDFWDTRKYVSSLLQVVLNLAFMLRAGIESDHLKYNLYSIQWHIRYIFVHMQIKGKEKQNAGQEKICKKWHALIAA